MKFWAIAYQFEEDAFVNFTSLDTVHGLSSECLLPTVELAERIIEEELSEDFVTVEIEITSVTDSSWAYSIGKVESWA